MAQKSTSRHEDSGKKSIAPQLADDLPSRKKALYMDEAITKTKFGIFNYVVIIVSGVILYTIALESMAILYALPVLQCDLKLSSSQKGVLGAATFAGIVCASHLWGFLADTRGRRRVILPALLVAAMISIVCSFVKNFYVFTALRFLNGFFMSCSTGSIYAYLGEFHDNAHRGKAIMGAAIIFGISCSFVPLTAWAVINHDWRFHIPLLDITYKPWRLYMAVAGVPALLCAIVLYFLPESPKFVLGQGNKMAAYQILQKMNRWNNGKKTELELFEIWEEPESIENRRKLLASKDSRFPLFTTVWNQTAPLFKPPYLKSTVLICTIQFGIYTTGSGFFILFAEILNRMSTNLDSFYDQRMMMCDIINMKPVNVSGVEHIEEVCIEKLETTTLETGLIAEIIFGVGNLVNGLLINAIGKFPLIFVVLLTTGLSGIGCQLTDIPALQISLFLWLLSCGIASNVVSSATVESYPTALRAMALSISLMFARLGGVAGSTVAASLIDNHCEMAFYLSGGIVTTMGVLAFFIPNIHEKLSSDELDKINADPRPSMMSFGGSVKSF